MLGATGGSAGFGPMRRSRRRHDRIEESCSPYSAGNTARACAPRKRDAARRPSKTVADVSSSVAADEGALRLSLCRRGLRRSGVRSFVGEIGPETGVAPARKPLASATSLCVREKRICPRRFAAMLAACGPVRRQAPRSRGSISFPLRDLAGDPGRWHRAKLRRRMSAALTDQGCARGPSCWTPWSVGSAGSRRVGFILPRHRAARRGTGGPFRALSCSGVPSRRRRPWRSAPGPPSHRCARRARHLGLPVLLLRFL